MERQLHFIVNKKSKNSDQVFKSLLLELPKYTQHYKLYPTKNIQELDNLLSMLKITIPAHDILVVVGGDGSLNHFISLYQKYQFTQDVSYVPAGSGNDFARTHRIPFDTSQAIEYLFQMKQRKKVSFIYAQENSTKHYAVNSIGIGIDGLVNQLVNAKENQKNLGPVAYLSVLVTAFKKQPKFPITLKVDQGEFSFHQAQLVLVANNPFFGGGIEILPGADGEDDELDVLVANDVSFRDLLVIISKIVLNKTHLTHPKLYAFKSKNVQLHIDSQQYGQKDGEVFKQRNYNYSFTTHQIPFWI